MSFSLLNHIWYRRVFLPVPVPIPLCYHPLTRVNVVLCLFDSPRTTPVSSEGVLPYE